MIQLRLVLFGVTVVGAIAFAAYNYYTSHQQHGPHSYGSRRRRSSGGYNGSNASAPQPHNIRKRPLPVLRNGSTACSICLVDILEIDAQFLKCGHSFHKHCINVWFNSCKKNCPNCRADA